MKKVALKRSAAAVRAALTGEESNEILSGLADLSGRYGALPGFLSGLSRDIEIAEGTEVSEKGTLFRDMLREGHRQARSAADDLANAIEQGDIMSAVEAALMIASFYGGPQRRASLSKFVNDPKGDAAVMGPVMEEIRRRVKDGEMLQPVCAKISARGYLEYSKHGAFTCCPPEVGHPVHRGKIPSGNTLEQRARETMQLPPRRSGRPPKKSK